MLKGLFNNIYQYRSFIINSVNRDLQLRYKGSLLGSLWLILQPISMILIYTLVFSELMCTRLPNINSKFAYSIYLCSGVLTWNFFTETLNRLMNIFLDHASVLKKINFPRICLLVIVLLSSFINFLIIFILLILFMIVFNIFPGWILLTIIPILLVQIFFTIGIGIILSVMNVFIRDIGQFINILLQFWFWFTPIVYSNKILPEWIQGAMKFNPMATLIGSYQNILLYHCKPDWLSIIPIVILDIILLILSWKIFQNHSADIMDEI